MLVESSDDEEVKTRTVSQNAAPIPSAMWVAAFLIGMSSFMFGFSLASLNSCLVLGDSNSAGACYSGDDTSCPKGTIYDDLNLNTCKYINTSI